MNSWLGRHNFNRMLRYNLKNPHTEHAGFLRRIKRSRNHHASKEAVINPFLDFPAVIISSLSISSILFCITVSFLCGLMLSTVYRWTCSGTSYTLSYIQSLVAFTMISAIVIMVIGNNIARAFGLVGSMSIIRFRMAIKDTRDIVFIFFSLAIGMACGVEQYKIAVISTIMISMLIMLMNTTGYGNRTGREDFSTRADDR